MPLNPIPIRDFVNGVIHEDVVSDFKAPENSVNEAVNLHFDTMGNATLRPGLTILGNVISASSDILGLHQFLDEGAGTDDQIIAVNGTVAYYNNGGTWTATRSGLTTGRKTRFVNFTDRAFMVNGAEAMATWNGSSASPWSTTYNVGGAPVGNFIEVYKNRVWAQNGSNPSRIEYSSAVSSTGTLTWDSNEQFINVSPGDGEDLTGLKASPRALLVFKPAHIYRIFNHNEADPDPQIFVGTYSNESIVVAKDGIYFHDWNNAAIHKYTGAYPEEISKPIRPYLEGVTLANRNDVAGWVDNDHVYESAGNITLNGVTFVNVVFRFTISSQIWTIYSYPEQILVATAYDDGATREPVVGTDNGSVYRFNNGTTDNGTPITFSLVTRWYDISGVRSYTDTIEKMAALSRNAQGVCKIQYQTNLWNKEREWKPIREIQKVPVDIFDTNITGNRVRFRLSGTASGEPFVFEGFEILRAFSELAID